MATNNKEKLVVNSVDKAIKSYMDDNISPEDYKKLITKVVQCGNLFFNPIKL
jgi:hypothetical protein